MGNDVDFLETAPVHRRDYSATLLLRPTDRLRVEGRYASTSFARRADGTPVLSTRIPRVKAEYQIARPIFVRIVAQYESLSREALRDPRTGQVLLLPNASGTLAPSARSASNTFRTDWLFSYRPSPGTVFFAGYGNTLSERDPLAFRDLSRQSDALFVKVSYVVGARGP